MIAQILIPTDFSPAAWNATKYGLEMARLNHAKLNLLHIVPMGPHFSEKIRPHFLPEQLENVKLRMNKISSGLIEESHVTIQNFVLPGNVTDTLLDFIEKHSYDLIILGVNSHGANNELGSHTLMMIEKSGVPVLIVPNSPLSKENLTE